MSLGAVRKYAQHFIYWRRGIAIPPLHARDTYILSPNCDLSKLPQAAQDWQKAFSMAPPLPAFLTDLSVAPRPYKSFCPSKPHRPIYLQMLTWLMRGGWVTQLCTFAYVVVWPELLYEVDYEMESEEIAAVAAQATKEQAAASLASSPKRPGDDPTSVSPSSLVTSASISASASKRQTEVTPAGGGGGSSSGNKSEEAVTLLLPPAPLTTTTEHTAEQARLDRIAQKASREAADRATAHARKTPPLSTPHPSTNDAPHLAGFVPYVIYDTRKATGKESRFLAAIARRFEDEKVRTAWGVMCKYFDGRTALDRVALLEDRKRKEVWGLLSSMGEWLLCVRHW